MPSSSARWATGLGVSFRPRPAGASGRVTTPTSSCAEPAIASRAGSAGSGVPANTSLTRTILGGRSEGQRVDLDPDRAQLAGRPEPLHLAQRVGEGGAVDAGH